MTWKLNQTKLLKVCILKNLEIISYKKIKIRWDFLVSIFKLFYRKLLQDNAIRMQTKAIQVVFEKDRNSPS